MKRAVKTVNSLHRKKSAINLLRKGSKFIFRHFYRSFNKYRLKIILAFTKLRSKIYKGKDNLQKLDTGKNQFLKKKLSIFPSQKIENNKIKGRENNRKMIVYVFFNLGSLRHSTNISSEIFRAFSR